MSSSMGVSLEIEAGTGNVQIGGPGNDSAIGGAPVR